MEITVLKCAPQQVMALRSLQVKRRWDWPAIFSTNDRREIWPRTTNGWTPLSDRREVRGLSPILDQVADILLDRKPEGGRFFMGGTVACCWDNETEQKVPFVVLDTQ